MNKKFLLSAVVSIALIQVCIFFFFFKERSDNSNEQIIAYFQDAVSFKENLADEFIGDVNRDDVSVLDDNDITLVRYSKDSLVYWSNNNVSLPVGSRQALDSLDFVSFGNASFLVKRKEDAYALILIAREFEQNNKFLKNGFARGLNRFPNLSLSPDVNEFSYAVVSSGNKKFCSINVDKCVYRSSYWLLAFIVLQFFAVLFFVYNIIVSSGKRYSLPLLAVFLAVLRYLVLSSAVSLSVLSLYPLNVSLTSSYSLLNLLLDASFVYFFFLVFRKIRIDFFKAISKRNEVISVVAVGVLIASVVSLFVFNILKFVIFNTDISLELSSWENIDISSYLVYVSLSFVVYSLSCAVGHFVSLLACKTSVRHLFTTSFAVALFFGALINKVTVFSFFPCAVVLVVFGLQVLSLKINKTEIKRILFMVHLFLISACLLFFVDRGIEKRIISDQKAFAESLLVEKDIDVERVLPFLSQRINAVVEGRPEHVVDRIQDLATSFVGKTYYISLTQCSAGDVIRLDGKEFNCIDFFKRKELNARPIMASNFKFIDEFDGVVSFIGHFVKGKEHFYIELFSKTKNEGRGYPEILDYTHFENVNNFSWAKYVNAKLVVSSGDFNFNSNLESRRDSLYRFDGGYFYNLSKNKNNIVVVSDAKVFPSVLFNIPYLFVILCLISIVPWLFNSLKHGEYDSFNRRIRNWFIVCLLVFFLLIGGASFYYNISRFQVKQEERISSLLRTLTRKLETSDVSTFSLGQVSDILQTDINVYSHDGLLYMSSRPEIFDKNIVSNLINSEAFNKIKSNGGSIVFNKESISDLPYLSVYAPLVNKFHREKLIINIPYFEESSLLRDEVINQFVSGLNIYIFISLLAIIIATFLAEKITKPLNLILSSFRDMELRKESKFIDYKQNDELGLLVKEYNKMAEKLVESANDLARSERESAWREMAKQIAHEIKNPLTPMKLSLQHLVYTKADNSEKWNRQFTKTSDILLEQIDNLASIASSFSDFSNIAVGVREQIEVVRVMESVRDLFADDKNKISLSYESDDYRVLAPRNQLKRAFINIVKNSLQAMQSLDVPVLDISLKRIENDVLVISFKDVGGGIDDDVKDQLFEPHFTTKSSGMGLGLAITKEIVVNAGGEIYFESEKEKGTSFFIKLPLCI